MCSKINITLDYISGTGYKLNDPEYSIIWKISEMVIEGKPLEYIEVYSY